MLSVGKYIDARPSWMIIYCGWSYKEEAHIWAHRSPHNCYGTSKVNKCRRGGRMLCTMVVHCQGWSQGEEPHCDGTEEEEKWGFVYHWSLVLLWSEVFVSELINVINPAELVCSSSFVGYWREIKCYAQIETSDKHNNIPKGAGGLNASSRPLL